MKQVPLGPNRYLYKEFLLSCAPMEVGDGHFQARVAVAYIGGSKTRSQRFIDLDFVGTQDEAVTVAQEAGVAWIDKTLRD
jgi:hypothetical protein